MSVTYNKSLRIDVGDLYNLYKHINKECVGVLVYCVAVLRYTTGLVS